MELRTKIVIKLLCLLILIFLCASIVHRGKDYDCIKCEVKFTSTRMGDSRAMDVRLIDLYEDYIKNKGCYVKWSETEGYYTEYLKNGTE